MVEGLVGDSPTGILDTEFEPATFLALHYADPAVSTDRLRGVCRAYRVILRRSQCFSPATGKNQSQAQWALKSSPQAFLQPLKCVTKRNFHIRCNPLKPPPREDPLSLICPTNYGPGQVPVGLARFENLLETLWRIPPK